MQNQVSDAVLMLRKRNNTWGDSRGRRAAGTACRRGRGSFWRRTKSYSEVEDEVPPEHLARFSKCLAVWDAIDAANPRQKRGYVHQ